MLSTIPSILGSAGQCLSQWDGRARILDREFFGAGTYFFSWKVSFILPEKTGLIVERHRVLTIAVFTEDQRLPCPGTASPKPPWGKLHSSWWEVSATLPPDRSQDLHGTVLKHVFKLRAPSPGDDITELWQLLP